MGDLFLEIWIDGYNLIRQVDHLSEQERKGGLETGRTALIRLLSGYRSQTGHRIVVVFDGDDGIEGPDTSSARGIRIYFSRPPSRADDLIIAYVRRSHGKKKLLVVSSDREILREADRHKISTMKSEAFSVELRSPSLTENRGSTGKPDAGESVDVSYWERVFEEEKSMFDE